MRYFPFRQIYLNCNAIRTWLIQTALTYLQNLEIGKAHFCRCIFCRTYEYFSACHLQPYLFPCLNYASLQPWRLKCCFSLDVHRDLAYRWQTMKNGKRRRTATKTLERLKFFDRRKGCVTAVNARSISVIIQTVFHKALIIKKWGCFGENTLYTAWNTSKIESLPKTITCQSPS